MSDWGTYNYGQKIPISESDEVIHDQLYEARFETTFDIPDSIELPLIQEYRRLYDYLFGVETTYVYVKGKDVIIQWKVTGSPAAISSILLVMSFVALLFVVFLNLKEVSKIMEPIPKEATTFIFVLIAIGIATYGAAKLLRG